MVKLVNTPLQLEPFLREFKDLFTRPIYNSFCDMSSARSVCDNLNSADQGIGFLVSSRTLSKAYSSIFVTLGDRYYQKSLAVDYVPDYIIPHLAELR